MHRTVPTETTPEVETWWDGWINLHPGWSFFTWRDPLDPADFPLTAEYWPLCTSGAQFAGLIRLEVLWRYGGIYLDSDVAPVRPLDALLDLNGFSAWEDPHVTPDAVLGAVAGHPGIAACLNDALSHLGDGAWESGPGATTRNLPQRDDWRVLPSATFYPYHYSHMERAGDDFSLVEGCYGVHHWKGSWVKR